MVQVSSGWSSELPLVQVLCSSSAGLSLIWLGRIGARSNILPAQAVSREMTGLSASETPIARDADKVIGAVCIGVEVTSSDTLRGEMAIGVAGARRWG